VGRLTPAPVSDLVTITRVTFLGGLSPLLLVRRSLAPFCHFRLAPSLSPWLLVALAGPRWLSLALALSPWPSLGLALLGGSCWPWLSLAGPRWPPLSPGGPRWPPLSPGGPRWPWLSWRPLAALTLSWPLSLALITPPPSQWPSLALPQWPSLSLSLSLWLLCPPPLSVAPSGPRSLGGSHQPSLALVGPCSLSASLGHSCRPSLSLSMAHSSALHRRQ